MLVFLLLPELVFCPLGFRLSCVACLCWFDCCNRACGLPSWDSSSHLWLACVGLMLLTELMFCSFGILPLMCGLIAFNRACVMSIWHSSTHVWFAFDRACVMSIWDSFSCVACLIAFDRAWVLFIKNFPSHVWFAFVGSIVFATRCGLSIWDSSSYVWLAWVG